MQISTGNRNGWVCTTHLCHWYRMEVRAVVDSPMCCWLLLVSDGVIFRTIAWNVFWEQNLLQTGMPAQYAGKRKADLMPLGFEGELCSWKPHCKTWALWDLKGGLWGSPGVLVCSVLRQYQCFSGEPFSPLCPCSSLIWGRSTEDPFLFWVNLVCQIISLSPIK